jgi:ferredoxin-thioredoxin reductase catalytic subunit/rubredoxin
MNTTAITPESVEQLYKKLYEEAESGGYHLHPDIPFVKNLVRGLIANDLRYGYQSCPCRLASGNRADDLDIICPCDYRDPDLNDYGGCYCALYVAKEVVTGDRNLGLIPERRPPRSERKTSGKMPSAAPLSVLSYPVWRCRVCGFICARDEPPLQCPICKVSKDRFERFM